LNQDDYDKALFYLHRMACDGLIQLMEATEDDFLSKKIEKFIDAFMLEPDFSTVENQYNALISYLDHVFVTDMENVLYAEGKQSL